MKSIFPRPIFLASLLALAVITARADDEQAQIAILHSDASISQKWAACQKLRVIGTAKAVPAVAALLTDQQLSQAARQTLGGLPYPEVDNVLREALGQTTGLLKAGIIDSLGWRGQPSALPLLIPLLSDSDTNVAAAAATALGRIDGPKAIAALSAARDQPPADVQAAVQASLLQCAERLAESHDEAGAAAIYRELYDDKYPIGIRLAAWRGLVLSDSMDQAGLMSKALTGSDHALELAALKILGESTDRRLIQACIGQWAALPAEAQLAVMEAAVKQGDAAVPIVRAASQSPNPALRVAAWKAMGELNDLAAIPALAQTAAGGERTESRAARDSLARLRGPDAREALLAALDHVNTPQQAELLRALGTRPDTGVVKVLLYYAGTGHELVRKAALQSLQDLALIFGPAQLSVLVQLVVLAPTDDARAEAADALSSICQSIESRDGHCDVEALVKAVRTGPIEARLALLPVCSVLAEPPVRESLRAALADSEPRVRDAALHALCDTRDGELLDDLAKVFMETTDKKMRLLAMRGCLRLLTQEEGVKFSNERKLSVLKAFMEIPLEAPEKRLVLSGLGAMADSQALDLSEIFLKDPTVQAEAAQAVIQVAESLAVTQPEEAGTALKKVLSVVTDPAVRTAAQEVQKKIWKTSGYITLWQVAGPYEQQGKNYSALFDIPFAPETGEAATVQWKALKPGTNPAEPWNMDLLKAIGGLERVAYARTWINSPKQQNVRLELGSDDGVKVWLNDHLVHANNVARALQPGSDKVDVALNKGWNSLLLKVTQFNQGWGFCVRFAEHDGEPVAGLKASLNPPDAARR